MSEIISKEEKHKQLEIENIGKTHISFSEFSLYNQCGHRHLIEKHLGIEPQPPSIHLFFGNAVHEAIEVTLKENLSLDDRISFFKTTFRKYMMDNMKESPDFFETDNFLDQGENILRILDLEEIKNEYDVVSIEEPLYEQMYKGFYFKGFLDLVLQHKKTKRYKVDDWKTSGQAWDVDRKKKDVIFTYQMPLYKFFWARKHNIPLDQIDCEYIVLNRLKNKKKPEGGYGEVQLVTLDSSKAVMKAALNKLTDSMRSIHGDRYFPKVKHYGNERFGCMFCAYKGGNHPLCDGTFVQAEKLLKQYGVI